MAPLRQPGYIISAMLADTYTHRRRMQRIREPWPPKAFGTERPDQRLSQYCHKPAGSPLGGLPSRRRDACSLPVAGERAEEHFFESLAASPTMGFEHIGRGIGKPGGCCISRCREHIQNEKRIFNGRL